MHDGQTFIVISSAGPQRDLSRGTREQAYWDDHAAFIDRLVEAGFILLGGPLTDEGGAVIVVQAPSFEDVAATLKDDPWYVHGILSLEGIKRWDVFIDRWSLPTAVG